MKILWFKKVQEIANKTTVFTPLFLSEGGNYYNVSNETMGIEFTGSRGTETYYATSDNKWQASASYVDRIVLPLKNSNTTSGLDDNSFLAWEANSAYWGRTGSHSQTDTTSVATLLT